MGDAKDIGHKRAGSRPTSGSSQLAFHCGIRDGLHRQEVLAEPSVIDDTQLFLEPVNIFLIVLEAKLLDTVEAECRQGFRLGLVNRDNEVRQAHSRIGHEGLDALVSNLVCAGNRLHDHVVIILVVSILGVLLVRLPHLVAILGIQFVADLLNPVGQFHTEPFRLAAAKPTKPLVQFAVLPSIRAWVVAVCRGDELNAELVVHLNDVLVQGMLVGDVVPLKLSVPAITKDVHHLHRGLAHGGEDGIRASVLVLPVVSSVHATKTSTGAADALVVLLEDLIVNTRVPIVVLFVVRLGNH